MRYIVNLNNTVSDANDVATRLNITGTVLEHLKMIIVDDPTQEQVDTWIADNDVKGVAEDQVTVTSNIGESTSVTATSTPTEAETFNTNAVGDTTQSSLAFNDGANDWYYWHLAVIGQRPRTYNAAYNANYTYTLDGSGVDLYILDSGVAGSKLSAHGGATQNAVSPTPDTIGEMHPEFMDNAFDNGLGDPYRVISGGVPNLNLGSGSGVGTGGWQNEDTQGHGTKCAMFAAGKLAGIAKKAYIWSAKCMDLTGVGANSGALSDLLEATNKVIEHHNTKANGRPSVANISIGVPFYRDSASIYINEPAGDTLNEVLDDQEKIMSSAGIAIARSAGNGIKDNASDLIYMGSVQAQFVTGARTAATSPTIPWNDEGINQDGKIAVGASGPFSFQGNL